MTKKILYTASTETHFRSFHIPYLKLFKELGFEVHVAYKGEELLPYSDKVWTIPFERTPFNIKNIGAYKKLKKIIDENDYTLIHCHTPTASVITRLAAIRARKKGTSVLYSVHGFHFFKGAPLKYWLFFFPIEWLLSRTADAIITSNAEDYNNLVSNKFPVKDKYKTNGLGINDERLTLDQYNYQEVRKELGYTSDDVVLLYIAEFNPGKRHEFILDALPKLIQTSPNIKLLFAGGGMLLDTMKKKALELKIDKNITFLGFKPNIGKYIKIADLGISASNREGFGIGVAEILTNSIPVIVTGIRGHTEFVFHNENGFLFEVDNKKQFVDSVLKLVQNKELRREMGDRGGELIKKYSVHNTVEEMKKIYLKYV